MADSRLELTALEHPRRLGVIVALLSAVLLMLVSAGAEDHSGHVHHQPPLPSVAPVQRDVVHAKSAIEASPVRVIAGHPRGVLPAIAAYKAANARMHAGMEIAFTGDADVDFIKGMLTEMAQG